MDSISEARLQLVCPALADKIRQMSERLSVEEIHFRVTQGLRSWNEQASLYAQGRSLPGKVVTNAAPGYSYHNFGLAVDVVPMTSLGPDWNESHPAWQRLVLVGTSLGLVAGAEWRTFPDYPHFQLTGKFPVSPDDEVRQIFRDGGMERVWEEAGLWQPPLPTTG